MNTESNVSYKAVVVLACIPTVDAILNQIANGLHLTLGSVSVLQVFRAILLIAFTLLALAKLYRHPVLIRRVPLPAFAALVLLLLWISKQWLLIGRVEIEGLISYGQMAYWLVLWIVASLICTTAAQAMLLLYGLALGALVTASSVLFGFAFGGLNFYEDDLVSSSAGWFNTAKAITGIMVCGAAVILYLGSGRRRPWIYGILATLCLVATMLTYARSGTVALVAIVLWLTVWAARAGNLLQWSALKWFLGLVLLLGLAAPVLIEPQTLFARWSDLDRGEDAGSGRVKLRDIALEHFSAESVPGQLLGSGFDSMAEVLYRDCGEDVKHTHNDTFDLLLIGGITGIAWQLSFVWSWGSRISLFGAWSLEGAAAVAIFIDYFCHAQLTGQLWGTDVMNYYLVALTAFTVIGVRQRAAAQVRRTSPTLSSKTPSSLKAPATA